MSFQVELPNPDLVDIKYEMSMLREKLELIREQIEVQGEKNKAATDQKIEDADLDTSNPRDEDEYWYYVDEHNHLVYDVLPRIIVNPFAVSVWAFYESSLREMANLIKENEEASLSFNDISGNYIVDQTEKYFEYVLGFPTFYDRKTKDRLSKIAQIRNAVAHGNGSLESLGSRLADSVREGEVEGVDISRVGNYFVLRVGFAEWAFETIQSNIEKIIEEYDKRY